MDVIKNLDLHEVAHQTAAECNMDHEDVERVLKTAFKTIARGVALKGYAELHGFGSFKLRKLAPRDGELPDGTEFSVGERITVDFNPFDRFRHEVEAVTGLPCIL